MKRANIDNAAGLIFIALTLIGLAIIHVERGQTYDALSQQALTASRSLDGQVVLTSYLDAPCKGERIATLIAKAAVEAASAEESAALASCSETILRPLEMMALIDYPGGSLLLAEQGTTRSRVASLTLPHPTDPDMVILVGLLEVDR